MNWGKILWNRWEERWREEKWREERWGKQRRNVLCAAVCLTFAALTLYLSLPMLSAYRRGPVRMEADCRLKNVTVEDIKQLEERERDGMVGILRLAAWRCGEAGEVMEPATHRRAQAGVIYAYGAMSLVFPERVLSGSCDQDMGGRDCVLTKGLSYKLFGSTDTGGCLVSFGGETYRVAAVIDKKEEILLLPASEGRVEQAAFLLKGRERAKARMEALGF